jgi:beta-glucosidase
MADKTFPKDFKWGTATAAYQIEGAAAEDGRGPSVWDTFSRILGKVLNGDTGDVGPDHYHLWQNDIELMRQLGVNSYRYSISWSRVLPQGVGAVNQAGLDFYDRLTDGLLAAGIEPAVTLYHWDLPQALEDNGGWANRSVVDAFANYTDIVTRKLGDRITQWITLNEPYVFTIVGYAHGRHAPGDTNIGRALQTVHNALLSHGAAVPIIRAASPQAEVGITLNLYKFYPASDALADKMAMKVHEASINSLFLDPVFGRGYPELLKTYYGDLMPEATQAELDQIAVPLDFLGINYYFPMHSKAITAAENPDGFRRIMGQEILDRGYKMTEMGWPVDAQSMLEYLHDVQNEYNPKAIYITENGAAYKDTVVNGAVHDPERTEYIAQHLEACQTAIAEGVRLKGYYLWSFMDNFEWGWGFSKRFGIVYIDYQTLQRIPKQSYHYYKSVIAANSVVPING